MLERTHFPRCPSFLIDIFSKALSFDRCVQVFYGFGDEKLVKMIDEVKVPADLKLNSEKVAPKVFVKVKLKGESHYPCIFVKSNAYQLHFLKNPSL